MPAGYTQLQTNKFNQYGKDDGSTNSQIKQKQTFYLKKVALYTANAQMLYRRFIDKEDMIKNSGKTFVVIRRQHIYDRDMNDNEFAEKGFISSRTVDEVSQFLENRVITEGQRTGKSETFKDIEISTTLKKYGGYLEYSGDVELFSQLSVRTDYYKQMGDLAKRMMEDLVQIDMLSTTNVMYAGAGTSLETMGTGSTADGTLDDQWTISYELIDKAVSKLTRNRAEKNTSMIKASTGIATQPIPKAYYAIVGPEVASDLRNIIRKKDIVAEFAFIPVHQYANINQTFIENEIGSIGQVRFIQSETALTYEGKGATVPENYVGKLRYTTVSGTKKFNVYPILFPSTNSFASVGLKNNNQFKINEVSPKAEHNNVYGEIGFYSFTFLYAGLIKQPERLLKLLVCANI